MEFADLDDDLFEGERCRSPIAEEYSARLCDPCWFMHVDADQLVSSEEELGTRKYMADYLFFKKEYNTAAAKYEEVLNILQPNHIASRRECLEGLVRCHVKKGTPCEALNFAQELHSTSKNCDHFTVSCSVLVDLNLAAARHSEALTAAQTLIKLHPHNWHVWLKLAYVYACIYGIFMPNIEKLVCAHIPINSITADQKTNLHSLVLSSIKIEFNDAQTSIALLSDTVNHSQVKSGKDSSCLTDNESEKFSLKEKGLQFVGTCLQRCHIILKKTEKTALGLQLDHNLMYQKMLLSEMKVLLDEESLNQIKMHLWDESQAGQSSPVEDDASEFVDRGSSKYKRVENEVDVEPISQRSFEAKWFRWIR